MTSKTVLIGALTAGFACSTLGAVLASAAASAGSPAATYTACVKGNGGTLYHVTTNGTPTCSLRDKKITWDQEGPPGANGNTVLNGTGAPVSSLGVPVTNPPLVTAGTYFVVASFDLSNLNTTIFTGSCAVTGKSPNRVSQPPVFSDAVNVPAEAEAVGAEISGILSVPSLAAGTTLGLSCNNAVAFGGAGTPSNDLWMGRTVQASSRRW